MLHIYFEFGLRGSSIEKYEGKTTVKIFWEEPIMKTAIIDTLCAVASATQVRPPTEQTLDFELDTHISAVLDKDILVIRCTMFFWSIVQNNNL